MRDLQIAEKLLSSSVPTSQIALYSHLSEHVIKQLKSLPTLRSATAGEISDLAYASELIYAHATINDYDDYANFCNTLENSLPIEVYTLVATEEINLVRLYDYQKN